ncbi:hypothetical protein ACFVWN_22910 [Nocardiopsis flavescens]|uniref:hypothetical protein n=1 Tax=Nocardiopsis flavescens TaxID=758803 RepID=UPI0036636473
MPSRSHEIPLRLIQNRPETVAVLLREALGYPVPSHTEAVLTSPALTNCDPKEWNADGAVLLRDGERHVLAVVVERQHRPSTEKRFSWPAYLVTLYGRLRCPAVLVVLCPDRPSAAWCAGPIEIGHPGFVLRPLVIGPEQTPVITDPDRARELPELTVLSAHAHGDHDGRVLKALVEALDSAGETNRPFYYDYVLAGLNEAARKELEGLMSVETYEWQSDFARKYVGLGKEQGREQGREEGREQGRAEGREQGREEGIAGSVLRVLHKRGLTVTDDARTRINSCGDLDTLNTWLDRALDITRTEDLFD